MEVDVDEEMVLYHLFYVKDDEKGTVVVTRRDDPWKRRDKIGKIV
jgi:hypothetical protein